MDADWLLKDNSILICQNNKACQTYASSWDAHHVFELNQVRLGVVTQNIMSTEEFCLREDQYWLIPQQL